MKDVHKKRVCIIHKGETCDPRSFYKQAKSLKKAGYDITVVGLFKEDFIKDDINLVGFESSHNRIKRIFVTNYRIFRRALKNKADIYHFHDLDYIPWAILLKLFTRSKVIYDIHEAYPEYMLIKTYIPKLLRKIFYYIVYLAEHASIPFFDAIIPNDNYVATDFNHKNNVTIFNFPTLDFFAGDKMMAEIPWESRTFDLFYHGSLPRYHIETMMRIAERLNAELTRNLWGLVTSDTDTVDWAGGELKNRGLEANFRFLPYIDYLSVPTYLKDARIGIIPLPPYQKFMKNIPLKMFEFMGCGLPVVLSDLPPSRQFIQGRKCAFAVKPDNIAEYAGAIMYLLNNPEKAIEMGENGRSLVLERYNWDSEERKLIQLYRILTKNGVVGGMEKKCA